jgi:hypothetical protein
LCGAGRLGAIGRGISRPPFSKPHHAR